MEVVEIKAELPDSFQFLLEERARYKGAYGGRGSGKSWAFAIALLIDAYIQPLRVVCARETQRTIGDSVHKLLCDRIAELGFQGFYSITENKIRGANGSEFLFHGLQHDPAGIKSLEGADRIWVEEAQAVSDDSWENVIPTIRKKGSEIWCTWNPRLETDGVHKRYVISPMAWDGTPETRTIAAKVNWYDNPFITRELLIEKDHLKQIDYAAYQHVWEGECKSSVEGAVYGAEMEEAANEGRITQVSLDRTRPIDTFWDLGFGDATAIWFAQALPSGQIRLVDYLENKGKTIEWYVIQLQQRGYMYGTDWLPHDGVDAIIHSRFSGDRSRSPEQLLRAAHRNVRVAPKLHVHSGINAVRTILKNCWFDETKCADGIIALKHYQWGEPARSFESKDPRDPRSIGILQRGTVQRNPLHDWASHGSDALRTMATSIKVPSMPPRPQQRQPAAAITTWS